MLRMKVLCFLVPALLVGSAYSENEHELRARKLKSMVPKRADTRTLEQSEGIEVISAVPGSEKTLTNYNIRFQKFQWTTPTDFMGVFPCVDKGCSTLNVYPIQYKPIVPGVYTMNFTVRAMPGVKAFRFSYVQSGPINYPEVVYQSKILPTPEDVINMPMQVRVSRVLQAESKVVMRIMWSQSPFSVSSSAPLGDILDRFTVSVGETSGIYTKSFGVKNVFNYDPSDLCDSSLGRPAATIGYVDPGLQVEVHAQDLEYNKKYFYRIVDSKSKSISEEKYLVTGPGPHQRTIIGILGDQGQSVVQIDEALEHTRTQHGMAQLTAPNSTNLMVYLAENENVTSFAHIGDLPYSDGTLSLWDTWLFQNEPVTSKYSYMVGIGNHEMDYSGNFANGTDSGGECGMPYITFFPFASQNYSLSDKTPTGIVHSSGNQNPWYSYDNGLAHITVMSSEHEFTKGSEQYKWLKADLQSVNRSATPWSIFLGHRPMYLSTNDHYDDAMMTLLQDNIEPLLASYNIDMAFWGHHHTSQRSCPGLLNSTCNQAGGLTHFVVGGAGHSHSGIAASSALFPYADNTTWGFPVVDLVNATDEHVRFFDNSSFKATDDSWVTRARSLLK
mmetsp:Transcript_3015/g.5674  ORF Transcript_3015/g.5674 Transcript_3015/m.5674 type:complete len:613 (-) Transcript_3015:1683-3521(-)